MISVTVSPFVGVELRAPRLLEPLPDVLGSEAGW